MSPLDPANLTAQLLHRAAGNPPSTGVAAAVSNAFPGLEFDFRNLWRRLLVGIELHEAGGDVVAADDPQLRGTTLVSVAGRAMLTPVTGPGVRPDVPPSALELSNAFAEIVPLAGTDVECVFENDDGASITKTLRVRDVFAHSEEGRPLAALNDELVQPGELTQSLCSPWQNDYRECACYYWAASRPDYVNVEPDAAGTSNGNNWLDTKRSSAEYLREGSPGLVTYDELFRDWQGKLRFIVGGRDHE